MNDDINQGTVTLPKADETMPVHDERMEAFEGKPELTFRNFSLPDLYGSATKSTQGHTFAMIVQPSHEDCPYHRMFTAKIYMDGEEVAELSTTFGKERTRRMAIGAMLKLIGHTGKKARQRAARERMG